MESSSGPDMKQKALPSFKLTCAAWPKAPNWSAALSSASKLSKNCCSVSSSLGKLPLVLSWVSMKYFTVILLGSSRGVYARLGRCLWDSGSLGHVSPPIGGFLVGHMGQMHHAARM